MKFSDFLYLARSDLYRYEGEISWRKFFKNFFLTPGFKHSFLMRLCCYLRPKKHLLPFYLLFYMAYRHYSFTYGIAIPCITNIGPGFYIGHYGGIVVNCRSFIGENCNISPGVIIGQTNRGKRKGCPTVGNRVYIGPGAKIIGNVHIGDDVAIGANCVVTHDVPDNAVIVGVPGRVISMAGSACYVDHIWEYAKAAALV